MKPLAIGACSGAFGIDDPAAMFAKAAELGVEVIQLSSVMRRWIDLDAPTVSGLARSAGVEVISATVGHAGEDYSTLASIRETGGVAIDFDRRLDNYRRSAQWLASGEITEMTSHMGFIPDDPADPRRPVMVDRVRKVADAVADHGVRLSLETGQETAEDLRGFLAELDRPGVGVNLDPANMILYGKGDPTRAIDILGDRIRSVHCKDAVASDAPGETWGLETPFGKGDVQARAWLAKLLDSGFTGPLVIEREAGRTRFEDIAAAVELLRDARPGV